MDVYYHTTHKGLRFLIGNSTEVSINDISIMYIGPTQLGRGGEMDISQQPTLPTLSSVMFPSLASMMDNAYKLLATVETMLLHPLAFLVYQQ